MRAQAFVRKPDALLGYQGERMNRLEAEYAVYLERLRMAGEICLWKFGQFKLRMADKTWYAPDFFVINKAGISEFHETKGFMRDDANVKLKTCAELYREFTFYLVRKVRKQWDIARVK